MIWAPPWSDVQQQQVMLLTCLQQTCFHVLYLDRKRFTSREQSAGSGDESSHAKKSPLHIKRSADITSHSLQWGGQRSQMTGQCHALWMQKNTHMVSESSWRKEGCTLMSNSEVKEVNSKNRKCIKICSKFYPIILFLKYSTQLRHQ